MQNASTVRDCADRLPAAGPMALEAPTATENCAAVELASEV